MKKLGITPETLRFLKQLKKNNDREWFNEHKPEFKSHEADFKNFMQALKGRMDAHDELENMKVFRIYRDVRFSKNKAPYKTNFAGSFSRSGAKLRGGYYLHVQPGASFIGAGFWNPNKEDLLRIRKELEADASEFKEVISDKTLKKHWGELKGEEVKTAPKGFDREHDEIALIRKKQFIFTRAFTDKEVVSQNFLDNLNNCYKAIRPYFDLMSDVLTTNLNGESLLK